MADLNNPLGSLATGVSQGLQIGQQKKQMLLEQQKMQLEGQLKIAQQSYEKIKGQADNLGQIMLNPKINDKVLGPVYNQWVAYQKVLNPGMAAALPPVKDITPEDSDIIRGAAQFLQAANVAGIEPSVQQGILKQMFNSAQTKNVTPDFSKNFKDIMDANFGTQPQQITEGNVIKQGTVNQFGQFTPIQDASQATPSTPQGKPVQAPNVPLMNQQLSETKRIDDLSSKFNEDSVVKDLRLALTKTNATKALIANNPKGDVGFIQTQIAKAAGEQRITDQDIVRFSGSTDAVTRAKRALSAIAEGKLSKADREDYLTLLDTFEKANKGKLQDQLDAYTEPLTQDMTVKEAKALKSRIGSFAMSELKPKAMTATNPKTGEKIQSLDGGATWQAIK